MYFYVLCKSYVLKMNMKKYMLYLTCLCFRSFRTLTQLSRGYNLLVILFTHAEVIQFL